jgi:NAD(P)-dependent dehydrogenase (short-subunit alcohol dehydrogenase family)
LLGVKRPEVVVVTGASAGVGRAALRAFARQGAHIGLVARGRAGLEGALRDVEALGGRGLIVQADVADAEQVERAADAVEKEFGPIDIWVNDAFCSVFSPARKMTPADYRRVTGVTYLGFMLGMLAALRRMLPRDRGIIVQVGSALAYCGIPLQSAYCAAKHAIQGFTESVRCELIHDRSKIKITMVQMPALNTQQFTWSKRRMPRKAQPVPPVFQPEVAGEAIVWAAHHYRREWYVGGSTTVVINGNKIAPGPGRSLPRLAGLRRPAARRPRRPEPAQQPVRAGGPAPRLRRPRRLRRPGAPVQRAVVPGPAPQLDRRGWPGGGTIRCRPRRHRQVLARGLLGLALGALASVAVAALSRPRRVREPQRPADLTGQRHISPPRPQTASAGVG